MYLLFFPHLSQRLSWKLMLSPRLFVSITSSFGRFKRRFGPRLQCFQNSQSMAHITEKVRSPRDEILSPALLHVGIGGSTVGTLCLRVSFHFEFTFLSADLSQAGQHETNMHCGYSLAWGMQYKLRPMQIYWLGQGEYQSSSVYNFRIWFGSRNSSSIPDTLHYHYRDRSVVCGGKIIR